MKTIIYVIILSSLIFVASSNNDPNLPIENLVLNNTVSIQKDYKETLLHHLGTGFVLKYNNSNYLITAKHIINSETIDHLYISKETPEKDRLYKIEIPGTNKQHKENDLIIVQITDKFPCSLSIENLFTFKSKDTILDIYSPGFPLGFSSPVFRKGVLFFYDINEEAVADMETLPGDSGAPVYSKELNKIVGIRVAKDTERNFAYIVLSIHIVNLLNQF